MAPPAVSISPICCVPYPASGPRRARTPPSSLRRFPRFAARRSSGGGGGTRPEPKPGNLSLSDVVGRGAEGQSGSGLGFTLCSCWCRRADDNESKAVLDAFFLGKAFAEALTERVESVVGEVFSVVGQWQAEQQKQVQDFQVLHDTILAPDYALSSVCNNNLQVFSVSEYQNL